MEGNADEIHKDVKGKEGERRAVRRQRRIKGG